MSFDALYMRTLSVASSERLLDIAEPRYVKFFLPAPRVVTNSNFRGAVDVLEGGVSFLYTDRKTKFVACIEESIELYLQVIIDMRVQSSVVHKQRLS